MSRRVATARTLSRLRDGRLGGRADGVPHAGEGGHARRVEHPLSRKTWPTRACALSMSGSYASWISVLASESTLLPPCAHAPTASLPEVTGKE